MLTVEAFSSGSILSKEEKTDAQSGERYQLLKLNTGKNGYVKFKLEVPGNGEYKLYLSYLKGPDCNRFAVNQRQIPVNPGMDARSTENVFVEKEYVGTLFIEEGTNTVTIVLKDVPEGAKTGHFYLHRIYLQSS